MSGQIDLSQLSAPDVVEALDYERILSAMTGELRLRWPEYDAGGLESEPLQKLLEVCAYRELLLRQRVNEAARAIMLAFARGSDLDHLAALMGIERQVVDAGDPQATPVVPPTYESDERLRRRVQMAPEAWTSAGSVGAYRAVALGADPRVRDVSVTSPRPGEVEVRVLADTASGSADEAQGLLDAVTAALDSERARPLTDTVRVLGADIVEYEVAAEITVESGPDAEAVRGASEASVRTRARELEGLGRPLARSALIAALHVAGVAKAVLAKPAQDLAASAAQSTHAVSFTVGIANG